MNCLNLDNEDVQQWIAQESLEKAYQVYVDNSYVLPDYSIWKQFNTDTTMSEIVKRFDAILPLSQFKIDKLSKLMNSIPIAAQAAYLQQVIYLSENPKLVDVYEEGFHAIFDSLISDEEKQQLLSASQSILAKKLKAEGKTINQYVKEIAEKYPETYAKMTQKQKLERVFEEELAKMYVDSLQYKNPYAAEKQLEIKLIPALGATIAKAIAKILTKAFDILKSIYNLFNGNRDTVSLFFKQINDGKYRNSIVSVNENNTIPSTRLLEILGEDDYDEFIDKDFTKKKLFSSEETQRVIRNAGSIFFQLQHEEIKNSFEDRLNESLFLYFKYGDIDDIYNTDRTLINEKNQIAIDALKSDVASYVRDFNALIDFDTDTVESEQGTTNHFANYDKSADENNPYETSYAKQLKLRIGKAGRIKTDSTKAFQIVPIDGVNTRIAFTEAVDVYKTYSAITRALSNIPTSQDRWKKLLAFAKLRETSDTKAFVEQLLYDMFKNEEEFKNMTDVSAVAKQALENVTNRKSGFIIFPTQEEIEANKLDETNPKYKKIIGTNNSVIVNSIVKGFDLYKRTNNILTVDVKLDGSVSTRLFDTNTNNVRDIQYNTWINSITEIIDQANREEPASEPGEELTTKELLQAPISEFKSINEEDVVEFANRIQQSFKDKGILLSVDYIDYSIAKFQQIQKGYDGLTTDQQFLLDNFTLDEDLLLDFGTVKTIDEINKAFSDITSLSNIEGKADEQGVIKGGIEGRLKNIAEGNSYFSESIPDTTYKTPDGKKRYSYQYKTFHLQRINQILKSKGILPNTVPNQDYINPEFITENYILKKLQSTTGEDGKEIESDWQKLINQGAISIFSAAGLRQQDSLTNGQKDESDGLTAGDMSNRDFMLYLLNSVVSLPSKKNQTRVTPIYFGNYEASTTYEFINLPFIKDLIDSNGKLTIKGTELIEAEIKKEFNRIKKESDKKYDVDTDKYTKYNTGKYISINNKKIPYKVNDNGAKEIDFSNFRALAFSDYVIGLIGEDQINFSKDFEEELTSQIQDIEEGKNKDIENLMTDDSLLYKAIFGKEYESEPVIESIKKSVDSLNNTTVTNIKESGAIELLDSRYNLKDEGLGFIADNVDVNIKKAATNNLLNTMFVNQLMQGDQSLLYKNDGVDMFKRFKMRNAAIISFETDTIAPEYGIDEVWKELPFLVHDEIKAKSGIDQKSIDQADAQNYGTLKYFRYAQYAMGRLNKDLAQLYDKIDQGEDTSVGDNKIFDMELYTPILKTVGFDSSNALKKSDFLLSKRLTSTFIQITKEEALKHGKDVNGRWVHRLAEGNKPAATMETVRWSDGTYHEVIPRPEKNTVGAELHDRRKVMEGWRLDEKGKWIYTGKQVMLSMPISASKLLNRNTLKGHDLKNVTDKNVSSIDLRYYGLQVETAHPHDKIPDPTQYLEIALNELKQELGTKYLVDGIELDTDKLINMYQEGLFQRDDIRFNELFNEIFTTNADGSLTFNKDSFKEIFVRSLEASGNEKQVIELAQEGQFNHPLIRDKYISQIFSYFTKDGLSQKRKGDAAPHFSSHGMKLIKKAVMETVNGKEHWSWQTIATDSDEYKLAIQQELTDLSSFDFYPDVDNKPHTRYTNNRLQDAIKSLGEGKYFIDELRHLKPRVENNKITGYFTEAILSKYEKDQARIYDGQRYMFGVRIPSQDKHSGVNLEWVDMLPAHYGSAVAVAKEIVQLSGHDFDVDKLYISKPDGYYTKDGFKQYDNSFEDYVKYQLKNNRALRVAIKDLKTESEDYQNLKLNIDTSREQNRSLYNKFKAQEETLDFNKEELKSLKKLYDIKQELEALESLIEHETATADDIKNANKVLKELQKYWKNNDFKSKDLTDSVKAYLKNVNDFYNAKESINELYSELETETAKIQKQALTNTKLPSDKDEFKAKFDKKYSNRGYINNLLLQANQQGLANNQTLDGKIADDSASLTYMGEGVLKEFPLVDGTTLLSDDGGKTFVGSSKTKYNVHSIMGHAVMHNNITTGKKNIGIDVNWNLLSAVMQRIGAEINPDYAITIGGVTYDSLQFFIKQFETVQYLKSNIGKKIQLEDYGLVTIDEVIENKDEVGFVYIKDGKEIRTKQPIPLVESLSQDIQKLKNNKELRVFDVNSTLTSSATDEVKEQLNARYGLNIDALNAILPLINMGGNMSIGIALVNQQIIKNFLALKSEKDQGILTKEEKQNRSNNQESFIKALTGLDYAELMALEGTYSIEDLAKGIRPEGNISIKNLVLRDFIKLSEITEYGANLIEGIKLKKGLPTDIYSFESLMENLDELDVFKDDSPVRPIKLKEALNNNKDTRAKELFGKLNIINKINKFLPELINLKKKAFTDIKDKLKSETAYLSRDAKQELDNELESFIYSQLLIKELKAIEGNTDDSNILKYLNRELIENGTDINNIELQFIKFKASSSKVSQLAENVLLKKLQISKKKDIVSLTLNQLVKLNDTEMSELQDSFTYLTNFTSPLEDSISPLEFTKMLQALFIVKDGMQFKYDGISKIFPTATFNRFGKVLELESDFTLSEQEQKEFIKRYMESVKHKSSVRNVFISVDKTEGSVISGNQVKIDRNEEKVNSKVLNDKGQHYNYVYFRNENFDALYYKTNENANSVVYTRVDNTGASNISTMGIPMGQLVTGQKELSNFPQVLPITSMAGQSPVESTNSAREYEYDEYGELVPIFTEEEENTSILKEMYDELHPNDRFKHDGNLETTLLKLQNIKNTVSRGINYTNIINGYINYIKGIISRKDFKVKIDQFNYTLNTTTGEVVHNAKAGDKIETNKTQINKVLVQYGLEYDLPIKSFNNSEYVKVNDKILNISNANEVTQKEILDLFKTQPTSISQALNFGKKSKNKVIPERSSDTNDIIFEDKENVYLMNNQQQEAFNKIKKVIDNFYSTTYSDTTISFENDYLKSLYNGKVSASLFNNMYGIQGSGGVGKTTLAKAISEYFMKKHSTKNLVFSSPTHKAATVLQESLGKDGEKVDEGDVFTNASLVGSLKEDGTEFTLSDNVKYTMRRKPRVGTDVDFIIFDEASMVDINYIQALESRIINSKNKKVPLMLFLGDMKQLPPISKDSKEFNRGFISMALLANQDKSTKLTQIMRSSDEFFVRIFNSIGNQIERNIYNKLEGKPAVPYNYSELMQLLNTSKENLTVYNNENSIVQEYAKSLFENLNPKAAYYSHYNRIDNTVTIDLQNKIRNSYMEKIYGTTSHLNKKIAFPLVDDMLNKFGAKTLLNDEGISKIEDLTKVLQFIEIENVRSFIFGDYVQAPSNLSIDSSYFAIDKSKLNSFAQKIIDNLSENVNSGFSETVDGQIIFDEKGSFKPSSRYRVLDIIQEKSNTLDIVEDAKELLKYTKMESVLKKEIAFENIDDNNIGIYIKNKDLTLENVLLYTRQNRIRANSYIMNTYSNYEFVFDGYDSNYKKINPRQIYTLREGGTTNKGNNIIILKLVVPWNYTKDEDYKRTLHLLGKNVSNFEADGDVYSQNHFTKSYLGSSHTTQGDSFTKIFAGVSNVLGQTMAGKDDVASSLYTILTRSMSKIAVLNKAATYTDSPQSDTTFEEINENC